MNKEKKNWLLIIVFLMPVYIFAGSIPQPAYTIEKVTNGTVYVITQKSSSYTFDSARYTIFVPENMAQLQGVFVHQHGCTMEGRGAATAYDVQYQAFAKKWKLAVVGTDLYSAKGNCHDWRNAASGSGQALIKSLQEIGELSNHPEMANAPWLLWGHSGGGYWALSMLQAYPERIAGIFGYSPAFEPGAYPKAALKVPVMMRHAGPVGDACCWQTSIKEFHKLRAAGGYASIAYTRHQNHNFSYVRYMAIPFFEAVMKQRFSTGSQTGYAAMRNMDTNKAWLGDTVSYNIYKAGAYPGNKLAAAWLPDSLTAAKWREYVVSETVIDRTPPPAPYDLQLKRRHNVTVEVSWKADADIESGISHFNIYKDNQLVGRFPQSGSYQQFDTNGDDAYPLRLPELRADVTLLWNDPGKIAISTVNHFGLESDKTTVQQ